MIDFFEWSGSILGLLGAFLLATHSRVSRYGWVAYLLANFAMIAFAYELDRRGLLIQQLGFTATSLLGLRKAGMLPNFTKSRPLTKGLS